MIGTFNDLLAAASRISGATVVVVAPGNKQTFDAIGEAQKLLPSTFILCGDRDLINHGLAGAGCDPSRTRILHHPGTQAALRAGIEAAREGKKTVLLKSATCYLQWSTWRGGSR